jgi:UDP-glucose 4-epimerase
LVTGGAGFIGSHLVDLLVAEGDRVVVVDDLSSGDADRVHLEAELEVLDISVAEKLSELAARVRPERIFHLGAQSSVTVSVADPERDARVNVIGTMNVLQVARAHRCPVVFTSTGGALYGDEAHLPTPETQPPAPVSPYGASKWAGEAYLRTWSQADALPHAICRLGNVFGPRQSPHGEAGVIAIFSHMLWSGQAPRLFGYGEPTRDYVHVSDVVEALRAASGTAGTFNIATGRETSVREVFEMVQAAAGTALEPELAPLREGELERSCMDPTSAREVLGWRAKLTLEEAVASTYEALIAGFAS